MEIKEISNQNKRISSGESCVCMWRSDLNAKRTEMIISEYYLERGGGDEIHRADGNWAETFWMKTNFFVSWSILSATFGPHIITLYPHTHIRHCIYTHHPSTRSTPHLWHSGRMKVFSNKSFRFPNEEIFPFFPQIFLLFGISFRTGRRRTEESGVLGRCVSFMCRRLTNANVPDEHSMCVCGG